MPVPVHLCPCPCQCLQCMPLIITLHLIIAWSDSHFVVWSIFSDDQHAAITQSSICLPMPIFEYASFSVRVPCTCPVRSMHIAQSLPLINTHMYHLIKSDHLLTTTWSPPCGHLIKYQVIISMHQSTQPSCPFTVACNKKLLWTASPDYHVKFNWLLFS